MKMREERKEIIIRSLPEDLFSLEKFIEEICDTFHINNTYFGNITVALTEAVQNAFIHGNGSDKGKNIHISFNHSAAGLCFTIKDQGKGFNFGNIPDPFDDSQEEVVFPGRGIFLIKTLADHMEYKGNGNEMKIIFKISSINRETSLDRIKKMLQYASAIKNPAH
ncbi:MAG: ATP-binding protein [Bacteroidales bacterium]|nr:ATP-binding protein [Bacteroidales bacterium]